MDCAENILNDLVQIKYSWSKKTVTLNEARTRSCAAFKVIVLHRKLLWNAWVVLVVVVNAVSVVAAVVNVAVVTAVVVVRFIFLAVNSSILYR